MSHGDAPEDEGDGNRAAHQEVPGESCFFGFPVVDDSDDPEEDRYGKRRDANEEGSSKSDAGGKHGEEEDLGWGDRPGGYGSMGGVDLVAFDIEVIVEDEGGAGEEESDEEPKQQTLWVAGVPGGDECPSQDTESSGKGQFDAKELEKSFDLPCVFHFGASTVFVYFNLWKNLERFFPALNEKKMNSVFYSVLIVSMTLTKTSPGLDQQTPHGFSIETLTLFSDAVFAIAITLLAIDIRVPQLAEELIAAQLNNEIIGLLPRFISFILTFFIVGNYWISYHRTIYHVKRYDRGLISLNLLFLMCIVLLPFPNDLIGKYPTQQVAVVVYAILTCMTGVSLWLFWVHASRNHQLIDETLPAPFIKRLNLRLLISPIIFLLSIPVSYLDPLLSLITWFCAFPLGILYERRYLKK